MSFDSLSFWIIFAFVFLFYWRIGLTAQNYLLLAASLFFYSVWDWKFTALLIFSSTVDFKLALVMDKTAKQSIRRWCLALSLFLNLGFLFFFKYYLFWVHTTSNPLPKFDLLYQLGYPLGISFYTFQILSYTIDVYRRKIKATSHFLDFILFVSFFPQLVAGPIEKARHLLPQVQRPRTRDEDDVEQGLYLCLWGLFKKVYVANGIAYPIDSYFMQTGLVEAPATILVFMLMTLQVYADFSGYSDIARGLGKMLGFNITINFKPFWTSRNPTDFWQKWNISLTRWLRDYVFLPLHKRHESGWTLYPKVILIMVLVGIWHAPSFNWVLFGIFNGLVIVFYEIAQRFSLFPRVIGLTLLLLMYFGNGLLHKTPDIPSLMNTLNNLTYWSSWLATKDLVLYSVYFLTPMFLVETFVHFHDPEKKIYIHKLHWKIVFCILCCVGIFFLERSFKPGFIYFEF